MAKLHPAVISGDGVEVLSALVAGAAADTNVTVTGLNWRKKPQFIMAVQLEGTATYAAPANLLAELKAGTTDSTVQFDTTVTTGDQVLLVWFQKA